MSYSGFNMQTGERIDGMAHLRRSIRDILTTPIGSRVMRRDYGCAMFDLIDNPNNGATLIRVYAAIADALRKWEPRIKLTRVFVTNPPETVVEDMRQGRLDLTVEGEYLPQARSVRLEGLLA